MIFFGTVVRFTSGADSIGVSISAHEHVCSIIYFCSYCVCLSECLILQARADDQAIYIIKPSQIFAPDLPNHC